ncbi:MAG TPA: response regulator [Candidatus Saccharimonadales bacterium]|nr:response regulator [Candidatus Saccharimonadales bacterium]
MRKILVVEDDYLLRDVYSMILSTEHHIDTAVNGQDALEKCTNTRYDLILLDLMMPVVDGIGFLRHFSKDGELPAKVIVLSNLTSGTELTQALRLGAYKNILKSDLSPRQLLATVRNELEVV